MAADFTIDPLAVMYKAWSWHEPGSYFGVPLGNYAGWFLVSFVICGITILLEKPRSGYRHRHHLALDRPFVLASIVLTLFCFLGSIIRTGSFLPAVLSLIFMGICWIYWLIAAGNPGMEGRTMPVAASSEAAN
jgi:putative membrane protein